MTLLEKKNILSEFSQILDGYITTPGEPENTPVEMLTINECAEPVKGLSKHTVRELVGRGELVSVRAGVGKNGKILVSKASLFEYLGNAKGKTDI